MTKLKVLLNNKNNIINELNLEQNKLNNLNCNRFHKIIINSNFYKIFEYFYKDCINYNFEILPIEDLKFYKKIMDEKFCKIKNTKSDIKNPNCKYEYSNVDGWGYYITEHTCIFCNKLINFE